MYIVLGVGSVELNLPNWCTSCSRHVWFPPSCIRSLPQWSPPGVRRSGGVAPSPGPRLTAYVYIYIYIYIYTYNIHVYVCVYIYIYIYTHTYIHTYTHVILCCIILQYIMLSHLTASFRAVFAGMWRRTSWPCVAWYGRAEQIRVYCIVQV